jgi:hypothetical protein
MMMMIKGLLIRTAPAMIAVLANAFFIGYFFLHHPDIGEYIAANGSAPGELLVYFIAFLLLSIFDLVMLMLSALALIVWFRAKSDVPHGPS